MPCSITAVRHFATVAGDSPFAWTHISFRNLKKTLQCLAPRSAGAASVLVWNATPWGGAIRAANAIPLLFSS